MVDWKLLCLVSVETQLNGYFESAQFIHRYYDDLKWQTKNRSAVKMRNHSKVTDLKLSTDPPPPHPEEGGICHHIGLKTYSIWHSAKGVCLPAANKLFQKLKAVTKPNTWKTSGFCEGVGVVMLKKIYSKAMVSVDVKHHEKRRHHRWPKSPILGINGHGQFESDLFTHNNFFSEVTLQAKTRSAVRMRNHSTVTPVSSSYVLNIMLFKNKTALILPRHNIM